jgi:hypothetical protein
MIDTYDGLWDRCRAWWARRRESAKIAVQGVNERPRADDTRGREKLKQIMKQTVERAELDDSQLAELHDLSKTDLFSKEGGEVVREVIEERT